MKRPRSTGSWFRGRNYDLGPQLDTFLVCAITGVIVNRVFLIITGYPQVGNSTLHISHAIYGAFAMMVALGLSISFLAPSLRWFIAVLGGLGFGWFVDEIGKFISRSAGYLFRPALAVIYVTFIVMFLAIRALTRRSFGPDDAVLNALESLKAAALGSLDDHRRREALARFDAAAPGGPFAAHVRTLLDDAPSSPPRPPGVIRRARHRLRLRYEEWTHARAFTIVIDIFFMAVALSTVASVIGLSLDGRGITKPSERIASAAASVAGLLVLIGVIRLRRSRLAAYRWFERGVLVWILVVQVYLFAQEQFAGVLGLGIDLVIWVMLRSAITVEEEREQLESTG